MNLPQQDNIMHTKDEYPIDEWVLVRSLGPLEYTIFGKGDQNHMYCLFEDMNEHRKVVDELLSNGAEVFEDYKSYNQKYPGLTMEENKAKAEKNLLELLQKARDMGKEVNK